MATASHRLEPGSWEPVRKQNLHRTFNIWKIKPRYIKAKKCSTLATKVLALEYRKDTVVVKTELC